MPLHSQPTSSDPSVHAAAPDRKRTRKDSTTVSETLQRVHRLAESGQPQKAIDLLQNGSRDPRSRNALGVCLLRAGRYQEAVDLYRSLVLNPGGTAERAEVPAVYKLNFATALLLHGQPRGCQAVIIESRLQDHPQAVQLQSAIQDWVQSLSWLRRLDWRINGVDPPRCKVPVNFVPGAFDFDVA